MESLIMVVDIRTSNLYNRASFTVVTSSGGSKTATLSTIFSAGVYTIQSIAGDTDLEIYLGAEDGTNVGSAAAGAKAVVASGDFKYVTTVNANSSDAIVFTLYKLASDATTLATKTDAYWAPPSITDVTPSSLYNQNATTTITGINFAPNVAVQFRKSDDSTLVNAKSVTYSSATSIIATRPDSFSPVDAPYDVVITNPSTGHTAMSVNAVTAGAVPSWVTSTSLPAFQKTVAYSQSVSATDSDSSPNITYSVNSSTLPTGITFSAGTFSGTPSTNGGSYSASIRATDLGGNYVDRTFTLTQVKPDAPTLGTAAKSTYTSATVPYTAPSYTGASSITTYTATSNPGSVTASLSQSGSGTITVTGLTSGTSYTFTVTATNSNGTSVASAASNEITLDVPSYSIGSTGPGGGIVFYDAGSTQAWGRYLEAAPNDTGSGRLFGYPFTQGSGLSLPSTLGSGYANTVALANAGSGVASDALAYNGGGLTDWFMPDNAMMNLMYTNRYTIGNFLLTGSGGSTPSGGWYLTSTYNGGDRQNAVYFTSGGNSNLYISDFSMRIRAVRAFS